MLIKKPDAFRPSEITPESMYLNRRRFLKGAVATAGATTASSLWLPASAKTADYGDDFPDLKSSEFSTDETLTTFDDVTSYNIFYEFGTGKSDPKRHAGQMKTRPWTIEVEGEVEKPGVIDIETVLSSFTMEERIYRLRCVEAWSMVIPWVGFPLADFIKRFQPTSKAKYVQFVTLHDPEQMPGQRSRVLDWPYVEGLRMDEAMHPLTILSVGVYGRMMPNQCGAPVRLVVPWKYGFKSIKSIVKVRFVEAQPPTSWNKAGPNEYGFYSNVNPAVAHPRWSQASERRLSGERSLFSSLFGGGDRQNTLKFNGYDQVASLYEGMDLSKHY